MLTAANWALYIERDGTEPVRSDYQTKPEAKQAALEHCVRSRSRMKLWFPEPKLDWHGMDGGEWRAIHNGWTYIIRPKLL